MLGSCSQYSTGRLAVGYHNMTAKYNAYLIAREKLKEAELVIKANRKEDYNQLMPILWPLDSTQAQSASALLQDVIKKASLVPDRHQNSKWVDNALIAIAKARLYKGQITDAVETLRYVNAKGTDEDDKHEALIWLMRAYIETKDYNSALSVSEALRSQPLNDQNTRDFYLAKAYLHQQKQEYLLSVAILEETFGMLSKNEQTARVHFAAAQMYDLLEKPALASQHYKAVHRNRPSYDLGFYASMNALQDEALLGQNTSAQTSFKKLLNDRKNSDLRDRLYYTMGVIETRKKNYPAALDFFQESIKNTTTNTSQVPYTYLEMARVYYDKLQNYELAKSYFDSSLAVLPKNSPQYQKIADRKEVLDEFVKQLTTIRTEDSLQRLAQLNPAALDKFLDGLIEKEIDDEEKRIKEAEKMLQQAQNIAANNNLTFDGDPAERFVLYDIVAMNRGKMEFQQKWGNRPLEDDWRRSSKMSSTLAQTDNIAVASNTQNTAKNKRNTQPELAKMSKDSPEWKARRDALYRNIPLRKQETDASNQRIEDAYYKLGKIYKFDLEEPQNAIGALQTLLDRFPATPYKPEAYYLLFLTHQKDKEIWKTKLLAEFPNSSYARLLTKAGGTVAAAGNMELEALKDYEKILQLYQAGNFAESYAQLEMAILTYAGSKMDDKYAVLNIFLVGKLKGKEAYLKALNDFVKDRPTSPLLPRVREILESQQATAKRKE
jgi:tetratricopeptide (TPR) repeat protein